MTLQHFSWALGQHQRVDDNIESHLAAPYREHFLLQREHLLLQELYISSSEPQTHLNWFEPRPILFNTLYRAASFESDTSYFPPFLSAESQFSRVSIFLKSRIARVKRGRCSVCLSRIRPAARISSLKCKHLFHTKCIRKWLNQRSNCPLCRIQVQRQQQE